MPHTLPRLSFEHVALALAKRETSPCVQWMRIPPGARSFLAARLFGRLGRTLLYLCAGEKEAEEAAPRRVAVFRPGGVLPCASPVGARPERRGGGEDAPPGGLPRRGGGGIAGGHARHRRLLRAPGHPRLRPPSRGGRPGGFRGARRDRGRG